jgi:hypothetical protein
MAYSQKVWDAIKKEWLAGQISTTEISRNYGPSRGAIIRRAKVESWPLRGSLQDEVRREIATQLVDEDLTETDAKLTPDEKVDAVQGAARRGLAVIRTHRGIIKRVLAQAKVTLNDLEKLPEIQLDLIRAQRLKNRTKMVVHLMKVRVDTLDTLTKVLARTVPLDRQAYSLDSDKGEVSTIKYVTPEMKKPPNTGLSVDSWDDSAEDSAAET